MDEILELYLKLGKMAHRDFLNDNEVKDEYEVVSQEIVDAEKEEYLKNNEVPPREEDYICPNCHSEYEEGYNFCTSCGLNLREYYENMDNCRVCGTLISKDEIFCKACGGLNNLGDIIEEE